MSRLDELKKKSTNVKSRLETLKSQSRTAKVFEESDVNKFISDYENFMKSEYNDDEASELKRRLTDIRVQYDLNRQGLSEEESELDSYLNKVKYSINNRKNPSYESGNYDEILAADDFDQYSKLGAETSNPDWDDTFAPLDILGWKPFGDGEKVTNMVTFAEQNASKATASSANALRSGGSATEHSELINLINNYMSPDEKAVYNYYIGKGETEKADEFLSSLTDRFRQQQAGQMVEQADGKTLELLFSAVAGLDQFGLGVGNLDNFIKGTESDPTSSIQYAQSEMSANNEGIWKVANDLTMNIGNMAPSMVVGVATGGFGGALTLGASAVGNSYSDMRNQGYSANQARAYATLVGASETALQYALGGISKLGGKLTNGAVSKFVSGLDNALAKTAIKLGGSMASEGLEESIQTALEPAFKALVTGEEYEAAEWEDIIYSGLLGSLSAGVLEGSGTIKSGVQTALNDRAIGKLYGDQSQQIIDDALSVQNNSELQKLAEQYKGRVDGGKNLKGSQINRLIDATDTGKIKSSILQRLGELGETSDVTPIAEALTKYAMGENLSRSENNSIKNSKFGQRVANELNPDNILSGEYTSQWAENIGTRSISPETYNKALYDLAKAQAGVREATEQSAVDKSKADFANATGDKFKLSENGNTKYKDADVTIGKVASTKGGLKVELDNGETVNASDIEFGSGAEAMMYEMVARMEVPVSTANEMLNAFKPTTAKQATMYFHNIPLAYKYGTINYKAGLRNINMSDSEKKLVFTRGRMDAIEKAKSNTKTTPKANQIISDKKNGIIYEDGFTYDEASANELQKVSMAGIETIAQMSSLEVHVFRSKVENGKRVAYVNGKLVSAPNGYFTDGNKIYIDFEAGNGGEGAMLYTMSHEVTHYIRKWNEKGFKELGDFLIEQYAKNKVSVTNLIEEQKTKIENRYEREGKALPSDAKLFDMAYEELVADAMSDMLTDPKAYEKLAKLKQQNKALWQKFGEAIKAVLDKLKSALGIYKTEQNKIAVAQEAHEVRAFTADVYEKLQDLYIKAFVQADANYESAKATGFAKDYLETKDIAYNLRATESHKKKLEEQYSKDASIDLETLTQRYNKIIDIWESLGGELNSKFLNEWNNKVGKDRAFTVFKAQAGYKYNVELSSMCKKGVPLFEAIDTIVKEEVMQQLDTKVLGKAEKEILYDLLKSHNFEIPCAICYVEQARQREGAIIDSFLNGKIEKNKSGKITQFKLGWNEVLQAVQKEMKANGVDYTFSKVDRSIATDKYAPVDTTMDATTQEAFYNALKKIANKEITRYNKAENKSRKLVTNVTPSAIKEVFKGTLPSNLKIFKVLFNDPSSRFMLESDLLYSSMTTTNLATAHNELYSLFNSQGGVSGYKTKQGTVVYWGDILGKSWKPSTVRDEGGIRNQSNSDFQMYTLLDQVQMYIDFTAKGYYLQAYTKVLSELKLFGLSRGKINASLIPAVYEYRNADGTVDVETTRANAGLDKNGNLLFDDIEGINHNEAFMLLEDAEYSKSIGGICIGYSDAHILKLLDDKRVQQIIGFHDKTDDPDKRYRGARYAKNYNGLNEAVKIDKDGNPKTIHIGFNPYVRKAEKKFTLNSKTELYEGTVVFNGKTYEADDIPKLAADMYLDMCAEKGYAPAYEDFAFHENYYKLLADFSLYDSQGHYAPHRKVAYNMPDTVPYLDINGKKQYMPTKDYIKAELEKELKVRDSISEALADKSENGLIPQFVKKVNELHQDQSETKLSDRDSYAPTFYSHMGKVIDAIRLEKMGANGVVPYLKGKGVKDEEIKWSGIETFLEGKKSVTKAELQEFVAGSQIQIEEKLSGGGSSITLEHSSYGDDSWDVMRGGEILDTYSWSEDSGLYESDMTGGGFSTKDRILEHFKEKYGSGDTRWEKYTLDGGTNYRELVFKMPNSTHTNQAMRAHWGQDAEGILVHARIQDFNVNGKKMLFVEELQSDWHNEGARDGYVDSKEETRIEELKAKADEAFVAVEDYSVAATGMAGEWEVIGKTPRGVKLLRDYREAQAAYDNAMNEFVKKIPDAPFRDKYHEYVLKRLLRMAAEEGYDSIGWTIADTQSKRWSYDYEKAYQIEYDQEMPKFLRKYGKKWGATVSHTTLNNESADNVSYVDNNGNEYKSIREWHDAVMDSYASKDDSVWSRFLSSRFKVVQDGQIMQIQDKVTKEILPETLNVQNIPDTVWSMDITDSMKESVLHEGQVLYSDRVVDLSDDSELSALVNGVHGARRYKAIAEYILNAVEGGSIVFNDGLEAIVDKRDAAHIAHGAGKHKVNQIAKIKDLINQAVVYAEENDVDHNKFNHFLYYESIVKYDGEVFPLYLNVGKGINDGKYHLYDITKKIRDTANRINGLERPKPNEGYAQENDISTNNISQKTKIVNSKFSDRDPNAVSNRTLLANALESVAQNDIEKNKLAQYKKKIALIESEQKKLAEIRAKANELRFTKGRTPADTKTMRNLDAEANQIANRISTWDKQLLNLESTTAIKNVLEREKALLRKRLEQKGKEALKAQKQKDAATVRELLTRHQESRAKAIEGRHKTEIRNKIKDVVSKLNTLLLNPTKEQHVPIGLQLPVAEALDAINMDTLNAEERVAYYNDFIAKSSDPDEIAMLTKKRDFFEYRDANFKERITALKNAYAEFKESDDPLIRNAHNDAIEDLIKNTADAVGNKSLKDMSLAQLEAVHNMYKAILATVRNSNKMFKEGRQETVTDNSETVKTEVKEVGGHKERVLKLAKFFKKFGWDMLKPVTAMKVVGSKTFAKLFDNVRAAEDTWAVDVSEAKRFYDGASDKYGFKKWDFKKRYSFKDSTGTDFSLSLEQIMSLYAYSKREQADKHLEFGGFIFDDAIEVTEKGKLGIPLKYEVNDANPYRLRKEDLLAITDSLTKEQKAFIDEMQTYLSEVMGEKGNEVSLAMYDIKLYNEKNYFPLKTSRYFREFDPEKSGTPKIKNSGFSKKTVPQAGNPIVLSNFMDVWASHVNDMSMYHAFVLPLEDFMRVYNYSSTAGGYDSVQQYIKNAYGSQANQYIEKLMDDLNGGARVDSSAGVINKGLSLFKKASVFASASVVVQQPSAIARAMAYINPKYFVTSTPSALNLKKHKSLWAEVKKYAPVAVIKEMGYFDTGVGRSTVEWLKGNKTIKDKMDDVLSKAPAIADELCWVHIWEAVKKETAAKHGFKVGSEDFLKESGRRFTEIITNTQVYDSVLSRSGMMRSKDTGMKMATAFMAEPTTTVNMMVDGIIQGKRGNKKFTAATVGAISASIILNSILVALVYAARDDDEDETYTEKYIGSVTSELLDGFNPLTYVPFVKDIWSIAQGYDVERSDMSVVSKLWESIEGLFNEDKSGLDKVLDATGAVSSLFGIPLKNIIRDAKGMYNLTETVLSDTETTSGGIKDTIEDSFKSSIPLWDRLADTDSKSDNLYDAIVSGDSAYVDRLKNTYKTNDAYETAVRKALRENDSRIHEAAQARYEGDISTYTRIAKEIIAEGNFTQDTVVGAINAEISAIKKDEATGEENTETNDEVTSIYSGSDINAAFDNGNDALALEIIDDLIETKVANGMEEKNAKSSVRSSMTSYWKPLYKQAYQSGDSTEMLRIRRILLSSCLYGTASDVVKTAKDWLKS